MVCAIELGLIEPPKMANYGRKFEGKRNQYDLNRWPGKNTRNNKPARKSSLSTDEKHSWFSNDRLNMRIKREKYSQDNLFLLEHQYSIPASSSPENVIPTKAQNIYYRGEKKIDKKTTVYNPFNALRDSSGKSNFYKDNREIKKNVFDDDDVDETKPLDLTRKCIFKKQTESLPLKERLNYGNKKKTIVSVNNNSPKPQNFPYRKQKDSSCLEENQKSRAIEICRVNTSKMEFPVARNQPLSSVSQDFSKPDIYEFNRTIKNQTGRIIGETSSDNSSENDYQDSQDFSQDSTSWNDFYKQVYKKSEPTRRVPLKRRNYLEPFSLQANKENKNSLKNTKNKVKQDDRNNNEKIVKEEKKICGMSNENTSIKISPRKEKMFDLSNPKTDYEDSEVDETLLVDPSTDLPRGVFENDEQDNEIINLNPQFDIIFDMNFDNHQTLGDDSMKEREKNENETENQSCNKKVYVKKSLPQSKKRKSSDSIVSSEYKENSSVNNRIDRITRGSIKNCTDKENNESKWRNGTLVWGNCMGWWPGLIVDASDVGMCCSEGKSWIYWIAESRISHLRDKTQIQCFSTELRIRMIETFRVKTSSDANYKACLATIKLLNDEILQRGPLTKPYHAWVEKHVIIHENIDQLIFHPYPSNVQKRLDELKSVNCLSTEKYLLQMKECSERKMRKIKRNNGEKSGSFDEEHLPLSYQKAGVITWAKMAGQIWWPAMIIDYRDCGMKEPNFGCQWILWYGDYTLSEVNHRYFLAFEKGIVRMKDYILNCKREVYKKGVVDAAKDFCSQYGYKTEDWDIEKVFEWFSRADAEEDSFNLQRNMLPGIAGSNEPCVKYPSRIVQGLRKHKGNCTIAAIREHNIKDSETLKYVFLGKGHLKSLCLMCLKNIDQTSLDHPFFEGSLCEECAEKYTPTIFAYGDDGKCFFCTICAGSDTVVMCDKHDCPRVYCTACLKYLIAPKTYNEIMMNDPFFCFLCENTPKLLINGLLKPRNDWKTHVAQLFHANRDSVPNQVEFYNKDGKKKLRVLSLFDGISAGLVVLNKLGIQIDAYYASEIDPDAEMVSCAHFGQEIIRLGDVRKITEEKIREIAPIHLLIGGSPCNDLSLVNPTRLGLHDPNGTGILVFQYIRIKNLLEKANNEQHFFWLFENVASMPSKYRLEINQHLGREPYVIDSANYSPQHRPRLYWSNFPIVSYPLSSQDLQDVLTPNCNRHALVKKIQTVTTRVNSLKQGKQSLKPILMNEQNDSLWITELEEIFGFPRHYTDVKNLCATKRQKLIGKSWSIQTIAELMRPLCNFFQARNQ